VWQHAVPLLESHAVIFPDETRCFDALADMYRLVRSWIAWSHFRGLEGDEVAFGCCRSTKAALKLPHIKLDKTKQPNTNPNLSPKPNNPKTTS
jgi:hypothetical protein